MNEYKSLDASRMTDRELDALTDTFRSGRLPVASESTLSNSAEYLRKQNDEKDAKIAELTEKLKDKETPPNV